MRGNGLGMTVQGGRNAFFPVSSGDSCFTVEGLTFGEAITHSLTGDLCFLAIQ